MNHLEDKNLAAYLNALADDELILGHRDSQWCGHAPILEEDIAFANIALDEIGHARLWLELAAKTLGEDPAAYPDQQAFFRAPEDFRNLQILELPNGDWAFSMLRQYLFDSFELARLEALSASPLPGVGEVAAKVRTEEQYHLRHTQAWVTRLAQGTEESARRMLDALVALWPYVPQMALLLPGESELDDLPSTPEIHKTWEKEARAFLTGIGLKPPKSSTVKGDRSLHTEFLEPLLADMQEVARLEPEGIW
jgi:ring-1,2-phenylacetyl-CoA epoxidase subunit PaaC